jgi:hypothetical protein
VEGSTMDGQCYDDFDGSVCSYKHETIQTISLIVFLIEVKKQRGLYLVIVSLSTMTNWSAEFVK